MALDGASETEHGTPALRMAQRSHAGHDGGSWVDPLYEESLAFEKTDRLAVH